jgi:hypothetical protein
MRGILGLILGAGGGWAARWAFIKAEAGDGDYNLVGTAAVIICIFGIILIILHIRKWWMSE